MHIRVANVADAPAIAKVHVDTWRSTYGGIVPDDFLADLSYEQRARFWHRTLLEPDPNNFVYVAEDEKGNIVGFASGGPERGGNAIYIGEVYAIYLLKPYQGKGIGRPLVAALGKRLIEAGMTSLLIWVLKENPSRRFYEALGWQPVYEKAVDIGGAQLMEVGYGWPDARAIVGELEGQNISAIHAA